MSAADETGPDGCSANYCRITSLETSALSVIFEAKRPPLARGPVSEAQALQPRYHCRTPLGDAGSVSFLRWGGAVFVLFCRANQLFVLIAGGGRASL